jgi:hypothetical protein
MFYEPGTATERALAMVYELLDLRADAAQPFTAASGARRRAPASARSRSGRATARHAEAARRRLRHT